MNQTMAAGRAEGRARQRIGRYVVTGRIGRGGMGMVYRGVDSALEREVAVKTLTLEGTLDEETRRRFEVEAKAAAKLQHPNIVTVFELGEDRGVPFIAMELLPGGDLEALLRAGAPMPLLERIDVVLQVCRGLHYAHEHRVVHRDVKPSNIRLLDDGTAKIMDFGIAKLGGVDLTRSGVMVGTVHYMSPEQIHGRPLDGRSDVFSVGVILYELLTGRRPFEGQGATEILYKIVKDPVPGLADLGPLTGRLQGIVDRALAKDPGKRYAGADRMAEDLAAVRADLQPPGPPSDVLERVQRARRLMKDGRVDESLRSLEELLRESPESLDAHRAHRAVKREIGRRQKTAEPDAEDFPELEVTFQAAPTRLGSETVLTARPEGDSGAVDSSAALAGRTLLVAAGVALCVAVAAGIVLLRGASSSASDPAPAAPAVAVKGETPVAAAPPAPAEIPAEGTADLSAVSRVRISIESQPAGAAIRIDGKPAGTSPFQVDIDTGVEHQVELALEGYVPQHVRLAPGHRTPVRMQLQGQAPPGTILVSSPYPIDVTLGGRVLAKSQVSPRILVPAGRQQITVSAPSVFLKTTATVEVRSGGEARIAMPATGELNAQAIPDSCQVFVDGAFVDYPPVLRRAIAAGRHTVSFRWTDGTRRDESIEVAPGTPVYVTGRRD